MSTQNQQTSTSSFDPGSMGVFQGLQPQFGQAISSEITDPYSNLFFNTQLGRQQQANQQQMSSGQQALLQRMQSMNMNPNSPFYQSQLNKLQRQGMANTSGGFNNLLMQAAQLRQQALGMAGSYRPLQTGQTNIQSQSGLGSWLPQIASAGLGIAGKFMGGGGAGGAASSFFGGGAGTQAGYTPQDFQGSGQYSSGQGQFGNLQPTSYNPGNPFLH